MMRLGILAEIYECWSIKLVGCMTHWNSSVKLMHEIRKAGLVQANCIQCQYAYIKYLDPYNSEYLIL